MNSRIVVVGSANTDLIAYMNSMPKIGETIHGHKFQTGFGGKGANQAVMAAHLTDRKNDVAMVCKIGEDAFGVEQMKNFNKQNMNVENVFTTSEASTGVAPIFVDADGNNSIVVVAGANNLLTSEEVIKCEEMISKAKVLVTQLEILHNVTKTALEVGRKHGVMTILNTAPASADLDLDMFKYADIVCPNETEAELIAGIPVTDVDSAKLAALKIIEMGAKMVIMTMGSEGALLVRGNDDVTHVSCPKVKAIDTVGAGDSFVGSLAYFIAEDVELPEAIRRACIVASYSVQKEGTQTSYPMKEDLDESLFL
eukprot:TRINITY_DN18031_c2_g1_i1.p1 TRINITY_DN18031_c2_g1~~TRINITY_DN18031_c2_g1_i1.p1  ORF type:complete len:322 (-),score=113.47 TRINITY_DN18031_c2_g1_i1:177-1109(-)